MYSCLEFPVFVIKMCIFSSDLLFQLKLEKCRFVFVVGKVNGGVKGVIFSDFVTDICSL